MTFHATPTRRPVRFTVQGTASADLARAYEARTFDVSGLVVRTRGFPTRQEANTWARAELTANLRRPDWFNVAREIVA
jgi:hypothetical protein